MSSEERNNAAAAAYISAILEYGISPRSKRRFAPPHGTQRFHFYALNASVPMNDDSWDVVVTDQRRLVAHALISALARAGHHAYLAEKDQEVAHGFVGLVLPGVEVDVDYSNYDVSAGDEMTFLVHFDVCLHVSCELIKTSQAS